MRVRSDSPRGRRCTARDDRSEAHLLLRGVRRRDGGFCDRWKQETSCPRTSAARLVRRNPCRPGRAAEVRDRKSTRLNSSHSQISYAVFCLKKKKERDNNRSFEG